MNHWLIPVIYALDANLDDEDAQLEAILKLGFGRSEAHRLLELVPPALSRAFVETFGVDVFKVNATAQDGSLIEIDLDRQPEYVSALEVGRQHMLSGCLPRSAFERITSSSAEVDGLSQALKAGADVKGSVVATTIIDPDFFRHLAS